MYDKTVDNPFKAAGAICKKCRTKRIDYILFGTGLCQNVLSITMT